MRFTNRSLFRCLSGAVLGATIAPIVALPAGASTLAPHPAPAASSIIGLGSAANACAQIRPNDVLVDAKTIARVRALRRAPPLGVPNVLTDPADFATFAAATMPRVPRIASGSHPTTPVEFATFRAARLVATTGVSVTAAISACHPLPSQTVNPYTVCPQGGCGNLPPHFTGSSDTNGNFAFVFTGGQQIDTSTLYSSNGSPLATLGDTNVTISNLYDPQTNGYINVPGVQGTFDGSLSGSLQVPDPTYVPQSGWVVLPGAPYDTYIDPAAATMTVEFDNTGNDYAVITVNAGGAISTSYHVYNGATLVTKTSAVTTPDTAKLPAGAREYVGLAATLAAIAAQRAGGAAGFASAIQDGAEQALLDGRLPDFAPPIIEIPSPMWGGGCGDAAMARTRGVNPLDDPCENYF